MAVKRYILTHRNDSGVVDTVHFQTDSDSVLRPDDSTVEAALSALKTDVQKAQQTADTAAGSSGRMSLFQLNMMRRVILSLRSILNLSSKSTPTTTPRKPTSHAPSVLSGPLSV